MYFLLCLCFCFFLFTLSSGIVVENYYNYITCVHATIYAVISKMFEAYIMLLPTEQRAKIQTLLILQHLLCCWMR